MKADPEGSPAVERTFKKSRIRSIRSIVCLNSGVHVCTSLRDCLGFCRGSALPVAAAWHRQGVRAAGRAVCLWRFRASPAAGTAAGGAQLWLGHASAVAAEANWVVNRGLRHVYLLRQRYLHNIHQFAAAIWSILSTLVLLGSILGLFWSVLTTIDRSRYARGGVRPSVHGGC